MTTLKFFNVKMFFSHNFKQLNSRENFCVMSWLQKIVAQNWETRFGTNVWEEKSAKNDSIEFKVKKSDKKIVYKVQNSKNLFIF